MQETYAAYTKWIFSSNSRMNIGGGGGNISDQYVFKGIWLILQLPINFSYTSDARFVKHPFMIHLSMLTMAMYIKSNSGF